MSNYSLKVLDDKLATGDARLTTRELQEQLGISPQSASNLLARWREAGLVDQVARGHYAIRQLGLLGTRAASEDIALAVGAFFAGEPHRIGYRSALDCHGLLTHPARTIQVACPRRITAKQLSGRALQTILEPQGTVVIGAEDAGHGAFVSGIERSLLDAAMRLDLVGGVNVLAEALSAADVDPEVLSDLARDLGATTALRRIGSLADQLRLPGLEERLEPAATPARSIQLDPRSPTASDHVFRDRRWRVVWPTPPRQLAEALRQ
jgi:predicted transcriptional regulator of viral defense system